jgi:hypothetical protein
MTPTRRFILLFPLMMLAMLLLACIGLAAGIIMLIPLIIRPKTAERVTGFFGEKIVREVTHMVFRGRMPMPTVKIGGIPR